MDSTFNLTEMYSLFEYLNDHTAKNEKLKQLAARLYGQKGIKKAGYIIPHDERQTAKVFVTFGDNSEKTFYLKHCWEGMVAEAAGLELTNLLRGPTFKYIASADLSNSVMAIDEIPGKPFTYVKEEEFTKASARSYGEALELAYTLSLGDRERPGNVILTPKGEVINIDFGQIFFKMPEYTLPFRGLGSIFPPKEMRKEVKAGRERARDALGASLRQHKDSIAEIIASANELGAFDGRWQKMIDRKYIEKPHNAFTQYLKGRIPELF